jgi:hypothetical protein
MPKEPKQKIKHIHNYPQSLRKTHCMKNYNFYNQKQTEFLNNRPENHWTEDLKHSNWEYYIWIISQLSFTSNKFRGTGDWGYYHQFQRYQHILRILINESTNITHFSLDQVRTFNENTFTNLQQKGKTV